MAHQVSRPTEQEEQGKIFNDPVHGTMTLGPKLVKVIDTPQFQRLRNIKQLGTAYHVYPSATHSRFEHSLGTAHLAGKFIRKLRANQPELGITDKDVLCVEMAGLCHDLGHGPYSHVFVELFLPAVGVNWRHETGSIDMMRYLFEENSNIRLSENASEHNEMVTKIERMIQPPQGLREIPPAKRFLYEFISNERNKVDVDKWDYFARDCHHLGIRNSFDHERFMTLCRVNTLPNGITTICAHKKESQNLYEMFHVRATIHRKACHHRIVTSLNMMLCEALKKANDHIRIGTFKMSEVIGDMRKYTDFDDNIIDRILQCDIDGLQDSKNILTRVRNRKFYKFVGSQKLTVGQHTDLEQHYQGNIPLKIAEEIFHEMREEIFREMREILNGRNTESVIGVYVAKFDYGMDSENPCENFYFYEKRDPIRATLVARRDISQMLPEVFEEFEIRVFCKIDYENVCSAVKDAFERWQENFLRPILEPPHQE